MVPCAADNASPLRSIGALIQMCSMVCWYHVVRLKLAAVGSWLPDAVTSEDRSNCMSYVGIVFGPDEADCCRQLTA